MTHGLRGAAAIVGIGLTEFGEHPGKSASELMAEAVVDALAEAQLSRDAVDGLFVSSLDNSLHGLRVAEYLGVKPSFIDSTGIGGCSFVNALQSASMALEAGVCEVALLAYGSVSRSDHKAGKRVGTGPAAQTPYEAVYKPRNPMGSYALAAARHMHEFGTTRENLSDVAISARAWACLNPRAGSRTPLTREEVAEAPLICDPFTRYDCCLISDAGAAVILVPAERARSSSTKPVYVLGTGTAIGHEQIAQMPDLTTTVAVESSKRAYAMASVAPSEVDVVQVYDAFTINTVLFLEDLGFCPKGEGGRFVSDGSTLPGAALPVNTNGGGLSCVHPGMYGMFAMIEAVEQLRGGTGERQVEGAEIAVVHGNGGRLSAQVTSVLGTSATL